MPAPPDYAGDNAVALNTVRNGGGELGNHGIVACGDATDASLPSVVGRAAALGHRPLADEAQVRRMKTLHELPGERALASQPSAARLFVQEFGKGAIGLPFRI